MMNSILEQDLQSLISENIKLFESFKNKKIFITGGTGFIGKWLLYSFCYANDTIGLSCKLVVVSRCPEKFIHENIYFSERIDITFIKSDVVALKVDALPCCDYYVHAATDVADPLGAIDYEAIMDVNTKGTTNVLEAARISNASSVLLLSSGAVYGVQPQQIACIPEQYTGAPDSINVKSAYGLSKRFSELLAALYSTKYKLRVVSARCFAFIGPFLPLDKHFAIGNFINDAIHGRDISIGGDGTPMRSYMYATDLVKWLLVIMIKGKGGEAYNVGSEEAVSIATLAHVIADVVEPQCQINIAKKSDPNVPPARYIPSIQKARSELGLRVDVSLTDAIKKTACWARGMKK